MTSQSEPEIIELDAEQFEALLCRLESSQLPAEDIAILRATLELHLYVTALIEQKSTTIGRLRKMLFGARTEKTAAVTGRAGESPRPNSTDETDSPDETSTDQSNSPGEASEASGSESPGSESPDAKKPNEKKKPKGHGRNGANDYPGAEHVTVPHENLAAGDPCPACDRGTLYGQAKGRIVVRFTGQPPVRWRLATEGGSRSSSVAESMPARIFGMF